MAFNCGPSWLCHGRAQQWRRRLPPPLLPESINDSPLRCPHQTRQWTVQPGWQLLPLLPLSLPPCPPPNHLSILSTLTLLCAQPRDLICLVISGLACSAQLHSKVKLDKGIGASPCKTASPWQLLEWAADCCREWRRREERRRWRDEGCTWEGGRHQFTSLFSTGEFCVRKGASYQDGSCLKWRQSTRCYWGPICSTTTCWSTSNLSNQLPMRLWQDSSSCSVWWIFL